MARGEYRGVNGVARKVVAEYRGAAGVARRVVKAYRGVSGVARQYLGALGKWVFQTTYGPLDDYPTATMTVYDLYAGWDGTSVSLRADAQASYNDRASANAAANLYGDFTAGGTLDITWRSSYDDYYIDKVVYFYGESGLISDYFLPQRVTEGETYNKSYTIPTGTTRIIFRLMHHSATRSAEYWTIDSLKINGKEYL